VPKVEEMLHRGRSSSPPKRVVEKPVGDLFVGPDGQLQKKSNARQPGRTGAAGDKPGSAGVGGGLRSKGGRMKRTMTKEEEERAREREGLPSRPTMPTLDCGESRILLSRILNGDIGHVSYPDTHCPLFTWCGCVCDGSVCIVVLMSACLCCGVVWCAVVWYAVLCRLTFTTRTCRLL